jgi:hypothetical protein
MLWKWLEIHYESGTPLHWQLVIAVYFIQTGNQFNEAILSMHSDTTFKYSSRMLPPCCNTGFG